MATVVATAGFVFPAEFANSMPTLEEILLAQRDVERRSFLRTRINRAALLYFTGRPGVHTCCIRDVTNHGAGIRLDRLNVLPFKFQVSFDNFRTIGNCRLIWRNGNFVGVTWSNTEPQRR